MRQRKGLTDEKRLAFVEEYLSSGKSKSSFEKENDLANGSISIF